MTNTISSNVNSKLLAVYIITRNSSNTKTLNHKKINFQINSGRTYHINYKYFMPKGFHLSNKSKSNVTCKYTNKGLSIPSITFTYVKNSGEKQSLAKPIHVSYIDIDNNQLIHTGFAIGNYNHYINVTNQVSVPKGYHLCDNQNTICKSKRQAQSIDLMVRPIPKFNGNNAKVITDDHQASTHSSDELNNNFNVNIKSLENTLHKYNSNLAIKLIHKVYHQDLKFFRQIIMDVFSNMKYKGINNLKINSSEHKISGVIKKYLYNNNQVNFTFIRAKHCDVKNPIKVSEVRDFVTSVMDHNCSKGIFITISHFTPEAKKEAERHSIILIDNVGLARLMINNNVGVKPKQIFKIVGLDKNFFN